MFSFVLPCVLKFGLFSFNETPRVVVIVVSSCLDCANKLHLPFNCSIVQIVIMLEADMVRESTREHNLLVWFTFINWQ